MGLCARDTQELLLEGNTLFPDSISDKAQDKPDPQGLQYRHTAVR